jgi:hypothetical protein
MQRHARLTARTLTIFARCAKFRADSVSPRQSSAGLSVVTMNVLELPPMESCVDEQHGATVRQ